VYVAVKVPDLDVVVPSIFVIIFEYVTVVPEYEKLEVAYVPLP
jgi:hypothetical protein